MWFPVCRPILVDKTHLITPHLFESLDGSDEVVINRNTRRIEAEDDSNEDEGVVTASYRGWGRSAC